MAFNFGAGVRKTGQQIGSGLSKFGAGVQERMRIANEKARAEAIERAKYQRELNEKMREARNKAHLEESVRQAKIQGKLRAKSQFGQHKHQNLFASNQAFDSLIFGVKPKAKLKDDVKHSVKRNAVDDLIWRL